LPAEAALPLHPHYAAIFLTDKSRQQLLQHVAPLHEDVSADHMTLAYKPAVQQCLQLPLGREAALFVVGAASDWRAQAVAVEHPSWLPYLSKSTPHVTISGKLPLAIPTASSHAHCIAASSIAPACLLRQHAAELPQRRPLLSSAVGEGVPAKEAGDLTAAALAEQGQIVAVRRVKLLQGGSHSAARRRSPI
jgi:hypothetical protein